MSQLSRGDAEPVGVGVDDFFPPTPDASPSAAHVPAALGVLLELAVPELAHPGALGTWEFILFLERTLALTWEGFSGSSQAHLAFGMCGSGVSSAVHTPPPSAPHPPPSTTAY